MLPKRYLALLTLGVLGAISAVVGSPLISLADTYTCYAPDVYHCYSVSELNDGVATTGLFGTWQNGRLTPDNSSPYNHVNTTIWLSDSNYNNWVEVGLIQYSAGTPLPYGTGYNVYWADYVNGAQQGYHIGPGQTADGSSHNYEIQRNSHQNWWNVYRDYVFIGTSTTQPAWASCTLVGCNVAGGELGVPFECPGPRGTPPACNTDLDTDESTGGFDLYLQSKSASGSWYYWPSQTYRTDAPCGPNPAGYCLNGFPYYTYEWSWNKAS